jgi:hypothetical protein
LRPQLEAVVSETEVPKRFAIKLITKGAFIRLAVFAALVGAIGLCAYLVMISMPGKSYAGPLPPLTAAQISLRKELASYVDKVAGQIGERNVFHYKSLTEAVDFLESALVSAGCKPDRQNFQVEHQTCCNLQVEFKGIERPQEIIVVGAHYDSVYGSPGANDNVSGVAAVLALARHFANKQHRRTLRLVLFPNEEPPFFQTAGMGSLVYAKNCRAKNEDIIAMLSLECIGYYSNAPQSQKYPFPLNLIYPSTGNFIGFVSNLSSRGLLHRAIASFRQHCQFPSQGGAVPEFIPGIGWSDHWAFWQAGYPAIMITDTAPFRYPHYHDPEDRPEKLNYEALARVVSGIQAVVGDLVESDK